jgi:hypothetical protein
VEQRDVGRSIRIVFDRGDDSRDTELVAAKIDLSVAPLVPPSALPRGGSPIDVAPTRFVDASAQQ